MSAELRRSPEGAAAAAGWAGSRSRAVVGVTSSVTESEVLGGPARAFRFRRPDNTLERCRASEDPASGPPHRCQTAHARRPVRSPAMHDQPADPLARFRWHPEPELLGIGDEAASRAALERLGAAAWQTSMDYLYREGVRRGTSPASYAELRAGYFGPTGKPGAAPAGPTMSGAILAEFTARLAPYQLNPYHPGVLSYFTPPPLALSLIHISEPTRRTPISYAVFC